MHEESCFSGVLTKQTGFEQRFATVLNSPDTPLEEDTVSVILVNYHGAADTITCLKSLLKIDWPQNQLDLIVVENSTDADEENQIRNAVPEARVIPTGANLGFAGGCNFGAGHARGKYLAFINNDARPDSQWISKALEVLKNDATIGCVASKVLDWEGNKVDFVNSELLWYGMGYRPEFASPNMPMYDFDHDVPFATGSAMFISTELFCRVGGFDERFFMFFEDVDLGWRLNLLGYRVRYVADSLVFHKHHESMNKLASYREEYLLKRNALLCMFKNYEDATLVRTLGPAMMILHLRKEEKSRVKQHGGKTEFQREDLCPEHAADFVAQNFDALLETRVELQAARVRTDAQLARFYSKVLFPAFPDLTFQDANNFAVDAMKLSRVFKAKPRVVIATGDLIDSKMAGPAIRTVHIADSLCKNHEVKVISTNPAQRKLVDRSYPILPAYGYNLRDFTDWADIIIFQGFLLTGAPWLQHDYSKIIIVDLYDPIHLEILEQTKNKSAHLRWATSAITTDSINHQIRRADLVLCASERQKTLWLGHFGVQPRQDHHQEISRLDDLFMVVPFGIEDKCLEQTEHPIKGTIPGIAHDDKVIIWGGGIYNWFDPLTLIQAVHKLHQKHKDIRLFFMGLKHPNPDVPQMEVAYKSQQLSKSLGLTDKVVFFNTDWVPYDERGNYLADADLGVSTHFIHVETMFSFRTRILDYLWAGLPIVTTVGDSFGDSLDELGIGRGVPPEDVDALAAALEEVLYNPEVNREMRQKSAQYAKSLNWNKVLEPLVEYCDSILIDAHTEEKHHIQRRYGRFLENLGFRSGDYAKTLSILHQQGIFATLKKVFATAGRRSRIRFRR